MPGGSASAPGAASRSGGPEMLPQFTCPHCGKIFSADRPGRRRNYCSRPCQRAALKRPAAERFWEKVDRTGDCWEWQSTINRGGYGQFTASGDGQKIAAHRMAWELTHGVIPEGAMVCHRCDNPRCCNPDHLFLGTARTNLEDMVRKGRSLKGHRNPQCKLTPEQVQEIRDNPQISLRQFAQRFGVAKSTVARSRRGETFAHDYDLGYAVTCK